MDTFRVLDLGAYEFQFLCRDKTFVSNIIKNILDRIMSSEGWMLIKIPFIYFALSL